MDPRVEELLYRYQARIYAQKKPGIFRKLELRTRITVKEIVPGHWRYITRVDKMSGGFLVAKYMDCRGAYTPENFWGKVLTSAMLQVARHMEEV